MALPFAFALPFAGAFTATGFAGSTSGVASGFGPGETAAGSAAGGGPVAGNASPKWALLASLRIFEGAPASEEAYSNTCFRLAGPPNHE